MKHCDSRWAELPPPVWRRPVLLLTRTAAHDYLSKAIGAEITTTVRGIMQEVPLGETEGVAPSAVDVDNVHVVAGRLLTARAGALAVAPEIEAERALGWTGLKAL